jgi:DNA-binding transcriptional LysR family regulator
MMNLEPNDLLLFARVVDEGSFSRAAERLGLPKSTVSRRVAALEAHLGERLLLRTTRKLTVTEFGQAVLAHAHHVVEDVEAAESLAQNRQIEPSGKLRVTMPNDLANLILAPVLTAFAEQYPKITLDIDLSARFVDLIAESFDVALRPGNLRDDATLAARRVATFSSSLYAAPAYVARRGTPSEPEGADGARRVARPRSRGRADDVGVASRRRGMAGRPAGTSDGEFTGVPDAHGACGRGIVVVNDHFALQYLEAASSCRCCPSGASRRSIYGRCFPGAG